MSLHVTLETVAQLLLVTAGYRGVSVHATLWLPGCPRGTKWSSAMWWIRSVVKRGAS